MTKQRALLAEDEPLARRTLRDFLGSTDWIEVVGEAADGRTALRLLEELRPDLLFLDVRMPGLSGLEVLERMTGDVVVVFTTAYEQYAVAAFELGAVDYLVKPFGRERFRNALERVRRTLGHRASTPTAAARARDVLTEGPLERLFVRSGDRILPLATRDIVRAEAAGDYVQIHTAKGTHLLQLTLEALANRLDPGRFARVHRSHVVNLDHVQQMRAHDDRRLLIRLDDGSSVVASRAASARLRDLAR